MPLESGHKVTIWSIEDKGTYAKASLSGQRKDKDGKWVTDWSNPFCTLLGKAYEEVKGHFFEKDNSTHINARIGWGYDVESDDGRKYRKAPFSVTNNYDKVKKINYTNYAIWDMTLTKSDSDTDSESNVPAEEPAPFEQKSVQPTPASNGLIGLDFLNIPDSVDSELPFK